MEVMTMNLTQIVSKIGQSFNNEYDNELSMLVQTLSKEKDKNTEYIVYMIFNIYKEVIEFKIIDELEKDSVYEYNYLGTNMGRAAQIFLTRDISKVRYLFNNVWNDLFHKLEENDMEDGELANLLKKLVNKNMIKIGERLSEGSINPSILSEYKNKNVKIQIYDKKIEIDGEQISFRELLNEILNNSNKNNIFKLIVPVIIDENENEILLPKHPDFIKLVKKEKNLAISSKKQNKRICHVCLHKKSNVSSKYTKKFLRKGINKVFTTTTKNTSQLENNFSYDNVYGICSSCFQNLLLGEKVIFEKFKAEIAGENAFILPVGYLNDFEYQYLHKIKKDVDLAFHSKTRKNWLTNLEFEGEYLKNVFSVNFIFYKTDGTSVSILETIEDVPSLYFRKIIDELAQVSNKYYYPFNSDSELTLGKIYNLIPVRVNKRGKQLNIKRILSLYKSILTGKKIKSKILFNYASEAFDRGMKQLSKNKLDNYYNMKLNNYKKGQTDFFIKKIVMGYLTLIDTLNNLGQLKCYYREERGERQLKKINTKNEEENDVINEVDKYLEERDFPLSARALFYLGTLIYNVGVKQYQKGHESKPILKKIQFQGMNFSEISRLFRDVVEKLVQYEMMTLENEAFMNRFDNYIKNYDKRSWTLSDQENILYIMSGYSFKVGNSDIFSFDK